MTPLLTKLTEIEQRAEKATPGPWEADGAFCSETKTTTRAIYHRPKPYHIVEVVESADNFGGECIHRKEDQEFIAASRTDIPTLTKALRRAIEQLEVDANSDPAQSVFPELAQAALADIQKIIIGGDGG